VNAAKKKAQAELESWKNVHVGPQWLLLQKKVADILQVKQELEREKDMLKDMECFTAGPEATIQFLTETEFLKDVVVPSEITSANLTLKGILATEVNEANPILLVESYDRGLFASLSAEDIILVLAAFLKEKGKEESSYKLPPAVSNALNQIDGFAKMFQQLEERLGFMPSAFWDLSAYWLGPIEQWLNGGSAAQICLDFGIYEGNLYRALMSLNNMLNELTAIATYCQHTEIVDKLKGVGPSLLRDIAINDSLYLRI
jgi:superfamily II RNA helicase